MSLLFESIAINQHISLKNKLIMSPMCQYSAIDGMPNRWHFIHYTTRAIGGVGAIIQEATAVSPEARISYGDLGIWNEEQMDYYAEMINEIKKYNCVPGIQLAHAGRKASTGKPWINHQQIKPNEVNGWKTVSSSSIGFNADDVLPQELDSDGIQKVINDFKKATERAIAAGYEIIEIHAAHGYLIHQFFSPLINQRTDQYGGSFDNRIRLILEIIDEMQSLITTQSLWIRISATDWADGGCNLEESKKLAIILQEKGIDVIDVSSGGAVEHQKIDVKKKYQVPFATAIKEITTCKVATVGLIDNALEAEDILKNKEADLIFMGRELLRNPYFPMLASVELKADLSWPKQYERAKPKH